MAILANCTKPQDLTSKKTTTVNNFSKLNY